MSVNLIWITPEVEKLIGYCARVSNPDNQDNPDVSKLLNYCIKNKHWSVFEMGNMCLEITTSRAISAQILRHKSFSFQEFSQRYAEIQEYIPTEARRQDQKNRQNSIDDLDFITKGWFRDTQEKLWEESKTHYDIALANGIAKEVARMLLPMSTKTRLYMNGSIRNWIHYIELRTGNGTQLEHKIIAEQCKKIFIEEIPIISKALGWINE